MSSVLLVFADTCSLFKPVGYTYSGSTSSDAIVVRLSPVIV